MLASIRTQVLFLFFMGMTLVVTALVSFTLIEVREHYTDLFHQRGEIAAQELAGKAEHLIELGLHPNEFLGFDEQCRKIVAETPAINYAALVDRGGKILYQSSDSKPTHRLTTQPDKKLAIKHPLKFASLNLGSYIYITLDKVAVDAQVDELLNKIVIMGIVLATIGTFVMMVFMRLNFIAPVNLLLQHIESMSLDRKPDLPSELANRNDELGTISSAFDHLADKVTTSQ
ncbi:MAG: hypothetical protein JAY91_11065, partial [Candidatus Thiodiazotropha endolucinida]|nr:hypothetical protein [Candidatus Thiodiazotropha taylori]MCW4241422.1 hypothetical protein [Candidatus Thiodiazotropha taylori]